MPLFNNLIIDNMKSTIQYILVLFLLTTSLSGCMEDDFLKEKPLDFYSSENFHAVSQ